MAIALNKTRMRDTRILMAGVILTGVFCSTLFPFSSFWHEALEMMGYPLVVICAVGRIYASAFIGGIKNQNLVTWGPYSFSRNPLYLFSLIGAAGIGLTSTSLVAFVVITAGFFVIYQGLIAREEEFLSQKFGATYDDYKKRTPRLWPSLKNYTCPEELPFQPKYLNKAVLDAVWWFAPLPLFELADYLRETGVITPTLFIP
jgi:protein-S-isoprenylcysteine O-methyltransferase Ste14